MRSSRRRACRRGQTPSRTCGRPGRSDTRRLLRESFAEEVVVSIIEKYSADRFSSNGADASLAIGCPLGLFGYCIDDAGIRRIALAAFQREAKSLPAARPRPARQARARREIRSNAGSRPALLPHRTWSQRPPSATVPRGAVAEIGDRRQRMPSSSRWSGQSVPDRPKEGSGLEDGVAEVRVSEGRASKARTAATTCSEQPPVFSLRWSRRPGPRSGTP